MPKKEDPKKKSPAKSTRTTKSAKQPAAAKSTTESASSAKKKSPVKSTAKAKTAAKKKAAPKSRAKRKTAGGIAGVIGEEHKKARKLKVSRKTIKKDELKEASAKIVDYLTARGNTVLIIAGAIIVLFLVVVLAGFYRSSQRDRASELFGKARNLYDLALSETPPSTATLKGSLEIFDSLADLYESGVEASLANLYKGDIYMNLQEYEKAIESYNKFLASAVKNETYQIIAKTNIAYSYENMEDYDKAIELLKDISSNSSGYILESSLLDLGLAYELANKEPQALAIYQDFLKDYPTSQLIERVQERINTLQAK